MEEVIMKVLAVCGFGVGSSMILKMSIDKVMQELGVDAEVENTDTNAARGSDCDVVFTSQELADELRSTMQAPVYAVKKYMDLVEVKGVVETYLSDLKKGEI